MVQVTYDWERFKSYAEHCRVGTYSVHDVVEGNKEIRVKAGRLGFKAVYSPDAEGLDNILDWCSVQGFVRIEESVADEMFHV